jgi:hypothetical protein
MNAKNRLESAAFFVPDPWTPTRIDGPLALRGLYEAVAQAVNDNAQARVSAGSLARLLRGFMAYARPANWLRYLGYAFGARSHPWRKAMFLDLLLADVFIKETNRTRPHFATLFLNAAAHIQHHYLFCSSVYEGPLRNPGWYVKPGEDPIFEVYQLYDRIIEWTMAAFPDARFMIGTGLHQNPHSSLTFYWRLRDHDGFLRRIGLDFDAVSPRMSRDFLVNCGTPERALAAAALLQQARADDGQPLFEVDNRGTDLFVMLVYPREITPGQGFSVGDRPYANLRESVAFVALKNGEHDGVGYLVDTGKRRDPAAKPIALASIPDLVTEYLLNEPFALPTLPPAKA